MSQMKFKVKDIEEATPVALRLLVRDECLKQFGRNTSEKLIDDVCASLAALLDRARINPDTKPNWAQLAVVYVPPPDTTWKVGAGTWEQEVIV